MCIGSELTHVGNVQNLEIRALKGLVQVLIHQARFYISSIILYWEKFFNLKQNEIKSLKSFLTPCNKSLIKHSRVKETDVRSDSIVCMHANNLTNYHTQSNLKAVKRDSLAQAIKAVAVDMNLLGPNHLLQNALATVYERVWSNLDVQFSQHIVSVTILYVSYEKIYTSNQGYTHNSNLWTRWWCVQSEKGHSWLLVDFSNIR